MYKLTKEQRIHNLREALASRKRKVYNLDLEIKRLEEKIQKLENNQNSKE